MSFSKQLAIFELYFFQISLNREKSVPQIGANRFEFGWKIKKL